MIKETIILEDKLEEMFSDLPVMESVNSTSTHKVVFGSGDKKELNAFLKQKEKGSNPYPLIWLLYPLAERHTNNRLEIDDMTLLLAVKTNASMQNKERLSTTYKKVLIPLLDNIRYLFMSANIVNIDNEYDITKFPNYSDAEDAIEHAGTFIWDALRVVVSLSIKDFCYKNVIFK